MSKGRVGSEIQPYLPLDLPEHPAPGSAQVSTSQSPGVNDTDQYQRQEGSSGLSFKNPGRGMVILLGVTVLTSAALIALTTGSLEIPGVDINSLLHGHPPGVTPMCDAKC